MSYPLLQRYLRCVLLLVVQVLVLNHLHLFDYITPLLIGYAITGCQRGANRIGLLVMGFVVGVIFDMFTNTLGMCAASCTLLAMIQPGVLHLFIPRDAADDIAPTIRNMGLGRFLPYTFILMTIFHGVFYMLDAFSLSNWLLTVEAIFGGALLTSVMIVFLDLITHPAR